MALSKFNDTFHPCLKSSLNKAKASQLGTRGKQFLFNRKFQGFKLKPKHFHSFQEKDAGC